MARILLVDDEKLARTLYSDYLTGAGHDVLTVSSLAEAKASLSGGTGFDVVVTDLILPQGNGMEVLQHVKENYPGVEVVVITALDKVDPAVRAIKSGASEYLVKPVAPEALAHAVTRTLTSRQLLRENETLRRHVALLEAGQRIATTLEKENLAQTALAAFNQLASSRAVVLFDKQGQTFRLYASSGLSPEHEAALSSALLPRLAAGKLEGLEGFPEVMAFAAGDEHAVYGYAVLLSDQPPTEATVASAQFLSKNLALALKNLERFAEVEDLAYLDDLTHLFNMRYMDLVLTREVKSAQQTNVPFSLLFLDLDYLKSINDTHGHLVGSKLLVEVARVVKGCVRDNDVVARFGGDEYLVLLRATDSGGALKVGERIRRSIEMHQFLAREGFALKVTTCIGVASFPEHAQDKASVLDLADRAMYRGKKGTRNVIYIAAKGLEATPPGRHTTEARSA